MQPTTDRFSGYELEQLIGEGGMGTIHRARDTRLGRRVALRTIAPELAHDPVVRARLNREATVIASCEHPNVLPIYEAGEVDGRLFIATRWVDGRSVDRIVTEDGPLPIDHAVSILTQVASALGAAHALDVIHRGVRPSSVLVTPDGTAYLTDFGLAKRKHDMTGLTIEEHLVEAYDYVAPEYISGDEAGSRVDIYGLGCVLYVALTGQVPYPVENSAAKMYAHVSEAPPSARAVREEIPAALDAVVERALSKDPDQRQATPAQFASELEDAVGRIAASPQPAVPQARVEAEGVSPAETRSPAATQSPETETAAAFVAQETGFAQPDARDDTGAAADQPVTTYTVYADGRRRPVALRGLVALCALVFVAAPILLLVALLH